MKPNVLTIVLVIISLAVGYYLNTLANERNNAKLIAAFKAELALLNKTKQDVSPQVQEAITVREIELQSKITLLEQLS